ncbi:DUF4232 domain-containing protein [Streptomyces sp. NPDC050504]|uniref:DUF4232 domain-containing protein n=1 Tax=Streptomyces sp. NPDC050504 TaxID=3365618 RepID=UPI0037B0AC5D
MRTNLTRTAAKTAVAAATTLLAALALTACQTGGDDGGTDDKGSAPAANVQEPNTGTGTGTHTDPENGTGNGTGTGPEKSGGAPKAQGGTAKDSPAKSNATDPTDPENRVTCDAANTAVTAQPVPRPLNHMLITVTNKSGKYCDLYGYPAVRFGEAKSVPPVMEESKPQAVTTLAPGESGYAGVILSAGDGSGGNGRTVRTLAIGFSDREGNARTGMADAKLPKGGTYVDDALRVTYWLTSADDALMN